MPLAGKPLLIHMVERVLRSVLKGKVVVATTTDPSDDAIANLCEQEKIEVFRGHPTDLLDRHYQAAKKYKADVVLKIPSDCPLIDPQVIDKALGYFLVSDEKFDYVSNLHPASYPDGNDVEIMAFLALEEAWIHAKRKLEREHTTPYIWENLEYFIIGNVKWETGLNYSKSHRWTIDYHEDYEFIKQVYTELYPSNPAFGIDEILELLERKPEISELNSKYAGEYWYRNHIGELKTV
jgi:spore coat polysaccharide biosynthesis protein SpsF